MTLERRIIIFSWRVQENSVRFQSQGLKEEQSFRRRMVRRKGSTGLGSIVNKGIKIGGIYLGPGNSHWQFDRKLCRGRPSGKQNGTRRQVGQVFNVSQKKIIFLKLEIIYVAHRKDLFFFWKSLKDIYSPNIGVMDFDVIVHFLCNVFSILTVSFPFPYLKMFLCYYCPVLKISNGLRVPSLRTGQSQKGILFLRYILAILIHSIESSVYISSLLFLRPCTSFLRL